MKKVLMFVMLFSLLAGTSMAMDLAGKTGIGLRADSFSIRHFVNNNFAWDLGLGYDTSTKTGVSDSSEYVYSIGGYWVKEVYNNVLLESGVTLQGWSGIDAGAGFNGVGINPFIGGECFVNDHFAVDGKIFIAAYGSQMEGAVRQTSTSILDGNLGAHIYF